MTKGFWIPIELLHDKSTTMQEKLLLIEINQLTMLDKGCIASNNHFAETFKVKKESISRSLSSLEKKGFICSVIKEGSRNYSRTITINKMLFNHEQNVIDPLTKCLETKENKTTNTNKGKKTINLENASKVYDIYKQHIKASKSKQSCINNIVVWLKDYEPKQLVKAIQNYKSIIKDKKEKQYIKDCANFFGVKGTSNGFFVDYLENETFSEIKQATKPTYSECDENGNVL